MFYIEKYQKDLNSFVMLKEQSSGCAFEFPFNEKSNYLRKSKKIFIYCTNLPVCYNLKLAKHRSLLKNRCVTDRKKKMCDLLRKKEPTAIKRRFKTQLNPFSVWMLCSITTCIS